MTLLAYVQENPLTSAVAIVLTGVLLSALGKLPGLLWRELVRALTVQVQIDGQDPAYRVVEEWLSAHPHARRARSFKLASHRGQAGAEPGFGRHLLWEDGGLLVVSREASAAESPQGTGDATSIFDFPKETITFTTLGRSPARIMSLVKRILDGREQEDGLTLKIWRWYWTDLPRRALRPMESIVMPAEQREEILDKTAWFFKNRQWFIDRGIPYRYSYLFTGPPGTGKTSLVCGLASHFRRPVCLLNISTVSNDNDLLQAFIAAPPNCIILLEDVDAASATVARHQEETAKADAPVVASPSPPKTEKVTLSGLLNAIDGVAAPEGRLLIMTTNHPERLDAALIRKARVDETFEIGPLDADLVEEMAARFFPGDELAAASARSRAEAIGPRPAAEWQARFMEQARLTQRRAA